MNLVNRLLKRSATEIRKAIKVAEKARDKKLAKKHPALRILRQMEGWSVDVVTPKNKRLTRIRG